VVIAEGDVGTAYFAIESGAVAVTVEGEARANHLAAGQGFGEIALLRAVRRTATITAETDCVLWQIERDVFLDVVAGSSGHDVADRHIDTQLSDLAPKSMRPVDED
jgi:CRP-like cAMP-binding protein